MTLYLGQNDIPTKNPTMMHILFWKESPNLCLLTCMDTVVPAQSVALAKNACTWNNAQIVLLSAVVATGQLPLIVCPYSLMKSPTQGSYLEWIWFLNGEVNDSQLERSLEILINILIVLLSSQISLGTSANMLLYPSGICVPKLVVNSLCKIHKCPIFLMTVKLHPYSEIACYWNWSTSE